MGKETGIEWTHHTFNPWWGCQKVSPACDNCYAEKWADRTGYGEGGTHFPIWGKDEKRRFFGKGHWAQPLYWNAAAKKLRERKRVFCGSMCDIMEDRRDLDAERVRLYELIDTTPNLNWLLLTKRPQNFRKFLPVNWLRSPRLNVWGMTTVESDEYRWRIVELSNTPFAVRGLSVEPLLGKLDLEKFLDGKIDWIIGGGESGPGARPSHPDWFRSLRDQCDKAGVAFHFKQWGDWAATGKHNRDTIITPEGVELKKNQVWLESPDKPGVRTLMTRIGKKEAGRLLDGVEHNGYPEVRA